MILRPYQEDGVLKLQESYRRGHRAPLYVLPTGGGKSPLFCRAAEQTKLKGRRAIILVHRHELLVQASSTLHKFGVSHGLISPKFTTTPFHPVQVASVQTLVRRLDKFAPPDLIIIDEAHHAKAGSWQKIRNAYPRAQLLGVTATPVRSDGEGLDDIFDDLILGPSIGELIRLGYLVKPTVFAPPIGIDLTGIHKRGGDFDKKETTERIDKAQITGDAVDHYLRLCPKQPGIAFCVSVRHAEHVAESFRLRGVRAQRVDGGMDDSDRRDAIAALGAGEIDILTSADLIGEGVDIPRASVAIQLRPTYSEALHLQQVGRVLRPFPGKTRALILDHVGNTMRHGLPDEDRVWSLQGLADQRRKQSEDEIKIKQCERCFAIYEIGPQICPQCGLVSVGKPRKIGVVEGELEEITKESLELARKAKRQEQGKLQSLEELKAFGKAQGYKPGWAERVFNGRRRS